MNQALPITRSLPAFADLRAFLAPVEGAGDLARVREKVSIRHEMTAVQLAALRRGGPVLRFDNHDSGSVPVISNLFGTRERVAAGLGLLPGQVADFGGFLAQLRSPVPPGGIREVPAVGWGVSLGGLD